MMDLLHAGMYHLKAEEAQMKDRQQEKDFVFNMVEEYHLTETVEQPMRWTTMKRELTRLILI